ncbi:hypothetical protein ACHMW6_25560 [Pseudoduganella sp. UC29_106]|uniref:hypothetical protein n=1 Tax=Pseudoduganella sp. UC29_106 TaxID=3374553 RepID=UPI0037567D7C
MSLFSELYALTKARRIAMLVTSDHDTGLMTISVMPRPLNDNDAPFCKDLTLTAPPDEFDAGFLEAIATYRDKLLPLLEQAKAAARGDRQGEPKCCAAIGSQECDENSSHQGVRQD